jgi:Domain of unknown function (DUF4279)
MTSSERTFATFRVAGDNLVPDEVTKLLRIKPTLAYAKGQLYGPRHLKGRTGVWFLSTDGVVKSNSLKDHVSWLLEVVLNYKLLPKFVAENSLHAVLTCFWHGPSGVSAPIIPADLGDWLKKQHIQLETDFESDDNPPTVSVNLSLQ